MRVLVIGASGFVGNKLAQELLNTGELGGDEITELTLVDVQKPHVAVDDGINNKTEYTQLAVDMSNYTCVKKLIDSCKPQVIFHLAAVVSGEAEANFDLGYKVNVDGGRNLLEAIRHSLLASAPPPRLVFTSSLAAYGTPLPEIILDDYATTPRSSYGTQKAIVELLMEDYTRKGFVDAVTIRYPTIAIRPGKPNKAASSFISSIVREPLNGQEAVLPVNLDFRHTIASPRKAVEYLLHAATLRPQLPGDRTFNVPGVSLTVKEMIKALENVAGKETTALIKHQPDPFICKIVESWPKDFDCQKALRLGFEPDKSYEEVLRAYMQDELGKEGPAKKRRV